MLQNVLLNHVKYGSGKTTVTTSINTINTNKDKSVEDKIALPLR